MISRKDTFKKSRNYLGTWQDGWIPKKIFEKGKMLVQNQIKTVSQLKTYTRPYKPNRRYLHSDITLRRMVNLYGLHWKEGKINTVNK